MDIENKHSKAETKHRPIVEDTSEEEAGARARHGKQQLLQCVCLCEEEEEEEEDGRGGGGGLGTAVTVYVCLCEE